MDSKKLEKALMWVSLGGFAIILIFFYFLKPSHVSTPQEGLSEPNPMTNEK